MRVVRILLLALLSVGVAAGAVIGLALHDQSALVALVLARTGEQTGFTIAPAGAHLRFGSHLVVFLAEPRIFQGRTEVARMRDLRAVVSYHSLLFHHGLPLIALVLDHPEIRLLSTTAMAPGFGQLRPEPQAVKAIGKWLNDFASLTARIEVINAVVRDRAGAPVLDQASLIFRRQYRRRRSSPWLLDFAMLWKHPPFARLTLSGSATLDPYDASKPTAQGRMWFWGLDLAGLPGVDGLRLAGDAQGEVAAVLTRNGETDGRATITTQQLTLRGRSSPAVLEAGDYTVALAYRWSDSVLNFVPINLRRGGKTVATATCTITQPYDPSRTVAVELRGLTLPVTQLAAGVSLAGDSAPRELADLGRQLTGGQVIIEDAVFAPDQPLRDWTASTWQHHLGAAVTLANVQMNFPAQFKLPPLSSLQAKLNYTDGMLALSHGSAAVGASMLSGIEGRADLTHLPREIRYELASKGQLDAAQVFAAAQQVPAFAHNERLQKIEGIDGQAAVRVHASGRIMNLAWTPPDDYSVIVDPLRVDVRIKGFTDPLELTEGEISLDPTGADIARLKVAPLAPDDGSLEVNGAVKSIPAGLDLHDFTVGVHGIAGSRWLPLAIPPGQVAVDGRINGNLIANGVVTASAYPLITGRLEMPRGRLQLGFLRAPLQANSATLILDGKGLSLDLPGAELEGRTIDFRLAVADFAHPVMRIDANATALDFEVMKFIRMPWTARTAPQPSFPLPAEGHIAARAATFGPLPMSNMRTDFKRANSAWRVFNFAADQLGGHVALEISGHEGKDDWIHMTGQATAMDTSAIFRLAGNPRPPVSGHLNATLDLWADTDTDFLQTLSGTTGIQAVDGTVHRFALLTRLLSFVDVKNWLTAHFPDPDLAGIPFQTIVATFKVHDGDFYTSDLRLIGPVVEITAQGHFVLNTGTMDMVISLIPFDTVNWLMTKIPIIGENLADSSNGLVAAYFHVYGPVNNPTVVPKPITSVTEFVIKTLSLPINIIKPNTIKP